MTTSQTTSPNADLLCPLCDYNVQGLPEPRCPECGHIFEWAELTDPARMKLGWLFEHRRWLEGYWGTQWRMGMPWRFWRMLRPSHRLVGGRVVLMYLVGLAIWLGGFGLLGLGEVGMAVQREEAANRASESRPLGPQPSIVPASLKTLADLRAWGAGMTTQKYLDLNYPVWGSPGFMSIVWSRYRMAFGNFLWVMVWAVGPLVGGMVVLGVTVLETFGKAKLRPGHVVRVALYSADLGWAAAVSLAWAGVWMVGAGFGNGSPLEDGDLMLAFAAPLALFYLVWLVRFWCGVRLYLGLPRAWAICLAGGVIGAGVSGIGWLWLVVG